MHPHSIKTYCVSTLLLNLGTEARRLNEPQALRFLYGLTPSEQSAHNQSPASQERISNQIFIGLRDTNTQTDVLLAELEHDTNIKLNRISQLTPELWSLHTTHHAPDNELKQFSKFLESHPEIEFAEVAPEYPPLLNPQESADEASDIHTDQFAGVLSNLSDSDVANSFNDPLLPEQRNLRDVSGGANFLNAFRITKGNNITVAVLDSGLAKTPHDDLIPNQLDSPLNFIDRCGFTYEHGTQVAGVISATGNNNFGIIGAAPESKFLPVIMPISCGFFNMRYMPDSISFVDGVLWSAGNTVEGLPNNPHAAKVINISAGIKSNCSQSIQKAINHVTKQGVTVVVAAGNSDIDTKRFAPANCKNVIAVGATNDKGERARYSNYGDTVTIYAPGGNKDSESAEAGILSTNKKNGFRKLSGTSFSAPHVAAAVALILDVNPELYPLEIKWIMESTAKPISHCTKEKQECDKGLLDAYAAVNEASVFDRSSFNGTMDESLPPILDNDDIWTTTPTIHVGRVIVFGLLLTAALGCTGGSYYCIRKCC